MPRTIICQKLKQELEGLDFPPYPGELGKEIYLKISKSAWQEWMQRQTMFINEYRLTVTDPTAREFLENEMKKFLFEDVENKPEGWQAEN
jgi:Fe-S cluster biosynthesis and repair protein YggX